MPAPLPAALEAKAQEQAARVKARSADAILGMPSRLVATTDDTLFGDTAFALRAQAQGLVADAYAERCVPIRDCQLSDPGWNRTTDLLRVREAP